MIKAKQVFKRSQFPWGQRYHFVFDFEILFIVCAVWKLYFLEIGPVNQKLWPFKCMMVKTLNSSFLDWEDTLRHGKIYVSLSIKKL